MRKHMMLILVSLSLLFSVTAFILTLWGIRKDAYINLEKVYNGFKYKTELEEEYNGIQENRKKTLDSLMMNLKFLSDNVDKKPMPSKLELYERKRIEFQEIQERFQSDNERLVGAYKEKIFKRINEALKQYGKNKGYDYIFGAEGSGVLMYTGENKNITEEVIRYLNEEYKPVTAGKDVPEKKQVQPVKPSTR